MFDATAFLSRTLGERYEVEGEIGRGGMATVLLARDRRHARHVALKVLPPGPDEAACERFLREVEIVARLNHPHILALYDSGVAEGARYFVMPFVSGGSLRDRLKRERQLPVDEAIAITRRVAYALAYAHAQGVIHRDVKPENILLHEGEPMLADFGIARGGVEAAVRVTASGIAVGTPDYMSPEQALGEQVLDGRSDVYALACVLYEMLSGEPPFPGPNALSVVARRLSDPPPSVRVLRPGVAPGIDEAIQRAMAREPTDRTPSAAAFAEALASPGGGRPRHPVVAVLPFLSLSADPDNEYFADGITEDVIVHLSQVRTLDVISRASVMQFKRRTQGIREIADALGAGALVDGSVRRIGSRVRIVAQLADAQTGQHLWGETYDRELTDIFAIQTDVALKIAGALRAELGPDERTRIAREPTSNLEAYERFLRGRHEMTRFTRSGFLRAVDAFEEAARLDPGFALAHANLAQVWIELAESGHDDPADAYPRSRRSVERALQLDPGLAAAHVSLAYLKAVGDYDWEGAEAAFRRALDIQPANSDGLVHYGRLCAALGRFDEALALQKRAWEVDPLVHRSDVVSAHIRAGRHEEALELGLRLAAADPAYDRLQATLAWAFQRCGRHEEALAAMHRATELAPENTQWLAQQGQLLAMVGREAEARAVLTRLDALSKERYVSPYHLAFVYTGLGELDRAMDWLERAYRERAGAIYNLRGSFLLAPLREHPRFTALLRRLNLA